MDTVERLERLYRDRYARFYRLTSAVVGDPDLAHDAVQSGFARALAGAASWRGEGSLEGWVWRIVRVSTCAVLVALGLALRGGAATGVGTAGIPGVAANGGGSPSRAIREAIAGGLWRLLVSAASLAHCDGRASPS